MAQTESEITQSKLTVPGIITLVLYCIWFITVPLFDLDLPEFMIYLFFTIPIFNLFAAWTIAREIAQKSDPDPSLMYVVKCFFSPGFWLMLIALIFAMMLADASDTTSSYIYRISLFGLPCIALYYNITQFKKGVLRSIVFTLGQAWALLLAILFVMRIFNKKSKR